MKGIADWQLPIANWKMFVSLSEKSAIGNRQLEIRTIGNWK
jgi:hypothetical protein